MVVAHKTLRTGDVSLGSYGRLLGLLTGKKPASTDEMASWSRLPKKTFCPGEMSTPPREYRKG